MSKHLLLHRNRRGRSPWAAAMAGVMMLATMSMGTMAAHAATSTTVTFNYNGTDGSNGTAQTWTVPPGVSFATFDVFGAQGGSGQLDSLFNSLGGLGGEATAGISLTPGDVWTITVAGRGAPGTSSSTAPPGGFGGGASGAPFGGGGGGGASDVRTGGASLSDRVLIGGGGGGGGADDNTSGGAGGGLTGGDGLSGPNGSVGGSGGNQTGTTGSGTLGTGSPAVNAFGGGGGGGYWGGAGSPNAGGGGGGSGFGPSDVTFQTGVRSGNGLVTITYTPPPTPVPVGGLWQCFHFNQTGSFAQDSPLCFGGTYEPAGNPPWTFKGKTVLKVTDCCLAGDEFEVFDKGVSIGTTSPVATDSSHTCRLDPDVCFADPAMSHATFNLGGGSHSITIKVIDSPYGGGEAFFRVDPTRKGRP